MANTEEHEKGEELGDLLDDKTVRQREAKEEDISLLNYHYKQAKSTKIIKTTAMILGCSAMVSFTDTTFINVI